jgi:hypothetical protein
MLTEIKHMREALASYIEATYHLSNAKVVDLRRRLLVNGGIAQTPFIESPPAYVAERKYATLALPPNVRQLLTDFASKEAEQLLFDPPYEHQAQALEATIGADAAGIGIVVTTGTGSGKTESFLLPVLARLADEAFHRPDHFATRVMRALLLYPMNALVNDQLGRLRTLFGSSAVRKAFTDAAGRPAKFGRYTGRTLYPGVRNGKRDQIRLKTLEYYLKIEDGARSGNKKDQALLRTLREKGRCLRSPTASSAHSTGCATGTDGPANIGRTVTASPYARTSASKTPNCWHAMKYKKLARTFSSRTTRCSSTCCSGLSSGRSSRTQGRSSKRIRTRSSISSWMRLTCTEAPTEPRSLTWSVGCSTDSGFRRLAWRSSRPVRHSPMRKPLRTLYPACQDLMRAR